MSWSETKKICPTCRGKGRFIESSKNLFDYVVCRGTGKWNNQLCPVCAGKGKVNLESI
ncbi:MAG: hypothetical protein MUC28_04200 [Planctomycetes bacterium]|nr:hypothetical protein [Planctomycetota bacterium]